MTEKTRNDGKGFRNVIARIVSTVVEDTNEL